MVFTQSFASHETQFQNIKNIKKKLVSTQPLTLHDTYFQNTKIIKNVFGVDSVAHSV